MSWSFTLNGERVDVDGDPLTTLSQYLRRTGRTGTKEGCAEGDCGACTVLVSDVDAHDKPVWRSVNSCIAILPSVAGRHVVTVEGLADGDQLHPVQSAMVTHYGSQCGYCTPGFVMAMAEGYERADLPAEPRAICAQLDGNLCRCTGYRPIRDAMVDALHARDGADVVGITKRDRRPPPVPTLTGVDARERNRFLRPTTLAELLKLRAAHPEARLLAGATEIGVELRKKLASLPLLISTEGVAELRKVSESADVWHVGGAATLTALDELLASSSSPAARGIRRMLRVFASRPIRNRATLAGNIVTASPIGDMAPVLLALGADVVAASTRGTRKIAIDAFFTGYRKTALATDEVVVAIELHKPPASTLFGTAKVSKRRDLDISIVAAAFRVDVDGGRVTGARLAFGGVAAQPMRAKIAESLLLGCQRDGSIHAVLQQLAQETKPIDDVRAHADYRQALVPSLFERFWRDPEAELDEIERDPAFTCEHPWPSEAKSRGLAHDSARGHVTGGALYVDDVAQRRPMLEAWPVTVPHAHARITKRDGTVARAMPGVVAVLFGEDIPGANDVGAIRKDEILLAVDEVKFHGHPVALVVADTIENARRAAGAVVVESEPLPAILGIRAAIDAGSFHTEPHVINRGDVAGALTRAKHRLSGELDIGGQEHFYLETHAAFAERGEDDEMQVWSSTQHPSEVQAVVSHVLHLPRHKVIVTSPRMGGGFGGKETQGNTWAALASLAAWHTAKSSGGRGVRIQLDRDVDMQLTGKRHPFLARFDVGFDADGRVTAFDARLVSDGGWALDLSESILDRALFHLDNCYHFENARFEGRVARTHVTSHTAFRGFGGPQGMLVVEDVMGRIAQHLAIPADRVRQVNFYAPSGQETPYGQLVEDHRVPRMFAELQQSAELAARRTAIDKFNSTSTTTKRGLAITPVKFGISFTASFLNQAGALVHIFRDGTVQVNHGGTEMGQGLHTKMLGIVMRELGVTADAVRVMRTATDKVPNTSATAASSGADLNGAAVKAACATLRARLQTVAAALLEQRLGYSVISDDVVFLNGWARGGSSTASTVQISFHDVVEAAYMRQTSLSSTGFYRTPDIGYDKKAGRGKPFHYFAYGVAAAEVELCGLTGMKRVLRVDILHDVGDSLNAAIDRGQVEGGFIQGMGWLTGEELLWDPKGRLLTHSASTYQIPTFSDAPAVFRVKLLPNATQHNVVHGSKAVGEPPLMLALAVREALRDAVAAFGAGREVTFPSPLTHEELWRAVRRRREQASERKAAE